MAGESQIRGNHTPLHTALQAEEAKHGYEDSDTTHSEGPGGLAPWEYPH